MTEPTDEELAALRTEFGITSNGRGIREFTQVIGFASAVLEKWGTPQPVVLEPLTDEQWQLIADLTDSILTRATKDEIERVIGITQKGGGNAE